MTSITYNFNQANGPVTGWTQLGSGNALQVVGNRAQVIAANVSHQSYIIETTVDLTGDVQIDFDVWAPLVTGDGYVSVAFLNGGTGEGYSVVASNAVHIYPWTAGSPGGYLVNAGRTQNQNHYTFTRVGATGRMDVYLDGVPWANITDNTKVPGGTILVDMVAKNFPSEVTWLDNLTFSNVITGYVAPPPEPHLDPTYTETWTGTNGASWGSQWTHPPIANGSGTSTIQGNRGRQVASGAGYAYTLDVLNTTVTDFDLTISYSYSGALAGEQYIAINYRIDPVLFLGYPANGYVFTIDPFDEPGGMALQKTDAGAVVTSIIEVSAPEIRTTARFNVRIKVDGFRHRVRWWKVGDAEPATWQINVVDSTWVTGNLALSIYNGDDGVTRSVDWDDFALVGGGMWKGVGVIRYDAEGNPVYWITDDLDVLNASWWYGWDNNSAFYSISTPGTTGPNYVPMQWGDWTLDDFYGGPPNAAAVGDAGTLLGFNEPDDGRQANMSVSRALTLWPQLEATGLRLGSPAATTGGFNSWLASFVSGNGGGYIPRVDFICCHWYQDFNGGYSTVGAYLDAVHAAYPTKPIWLTEVGYLTGGPSGNAALIPTVMAAVLARPYVERVGWFCQRDGDNFTGSGLIDNTGTITTAGTTFAALPPVINEGDLDEVPVDPGTGGRTFESDAVRNQEDSVARVLESGATTAPSTITISAAGSGATTGSAALILKNSFSGSGVAVFTGSAALILKTAMSSSGAGISAGTATIAQTMLMSASGAGVFGGSAAFISIAMSASGAGQSAGSAALLSKLTITASGTGISTGSAAISTGSPMFASGTGVFTGSAALTIANGPIAHQMSASGTGLSDGTATLISTLVVTASGVGLSGGTATFGGSGTITASGTGVFGGSAALGLKSTLTAAGGSLVGGAADTVLLIAITASGTGLTGGSAAVTSTLKVSASGTGASSGQASLTIGVKLSLSASGTGRFGGGAFLFVHSGIVDLDVMVGPIRSVETVTVGPMRTPTQVGDFSKAKVDVGPIRVVEKYVFGALTARPPVAITNFKVPTVVSDFRAHGIVVGELRTESPVTVGV